MSIEQKYQKLDQIEHVLKRPGMYIGEVKRTTEELWVWDDSINKIVKKLTTYSPGFVKIFDEILTNAQDASKLDSSITQIKISFDNESISVFNNGKGIPIEIHKEHGVHVPELIFGHLLSGSNYNDNQKRIVGGLHGIGAKATAIFSKRFEIDIIDENSGQHYNQVFENNLSIKNPPIIKKAKSKKGHVKITFTPDYPRFSMPEGHIDTDTLSLLKKRVVDASVCTNKKVSIFLNNVKLESKCLKDYCSYYPIITDNIYHEQITIHKDGIDFDWEYSVCLTDDEKFDQVSFVNGISTIHGGKHVDYIIYQITNKLKNLLEEKKKLKDVKPHVVKDRMMFFLKSTIVNPSFSSQSKDCLTTQSKDFGCVVNVSDKFIDKLFKSPMITDILDIYKARERVALSKTDGKKTTKVIVPGLEDANWAGSVKSNQCTLILTEGLSAKTFAMWGRSIIGNDKYAVFPLKGKVLNFRDATISQMANNEELNNLKKIIGLKQDVKYNNVNNLRYGKVMILTDSDVDGSHIKGLIINFFHSQWPELLKLNFITTLKTPILKATKGNKVEEFYTEGEFNKWKLTNNINGYTIKYFKGLGTSDKTAAQQIFKEMEKLKVDYFYKNEYCDESILLAFDKDGKGRDKKLEKCSDLRKQWLSKYDKNSYIALENKKVAFQDFIHKDLKHFSIYDNQRSIPCIYDGLKPSQRKILYYMLNKNSDKSIKVAQLSGYISAEMCYHHGEVSLQGAIINMAQNFIGTNNINLLYPDGNFGSRFSPKDAASPRYIFTKLENHTLKIFNRLDLSVLERMIDDGVEVEPEFLVPNLPMILINGAEGIGTGFSTNIPCFNPDEIIDIVKKKLEGKLKVFPKLKPFYKNFRGVVEYDIEKDGNYLLKGLWEKHGNDSIKISEIPIGSFISSYKEFLENKIGENDIKDVLNKTTDETTNILFIVTFKNGNCRDDFIKNNDVAKYFKLSKTLNTHNMYLFNDKNIPKKYDTVEQIFNEWFDMRYRLYGDRKQYLQNKLSCQVVDLKNKVRFIQEFINDDIKILKVKKFDIIIQLANRKYDRKDDSFDYLINMPINSLTFEKIEDLNKNCKDKETQLNILNSKKVEDLWLEDLI